MSAEQSAERISTVCLRVVSMSAGIGLPGLISLHMSVLAVQPRGTRTSTERLRSPQQTLVGASW